MQAPGLHLHMHVAEGGVRRCAKTCACAADKTQVLSTIHQPRSSIFAMFDLLLLIAEGKLLYYGPAAMAVGTLHPGRNFCYVSLLYVMLRVFPSNAAHRVSSAPYAVAATPWFAGQPLRPLPHAMPPALQPRRLLPGDWAYHRGCAGCCVPTAHSFPNASTDSSCLLWLAGCGLCRQQVRHEPAVASRLAQTARLLSH